MKRKVYYYLLALILFCITTLCISGCGGSRAEAKIPESDIYPRITKTYEDNLIYVYEVTDRKGNNFMIVRATGFGGGVSIIEVK